jgi:hypothetical protein
MKQIGLAIHNYHDTHRVFPCNANGLDHLRGRPSNGFSWISKALPCLEQQNLHLARKISPTPDGTEVGGLKYGSLSLHSGGIHAAMVDGSIHLFISSRKILRKRCTSNWATWRTACRWADSSRRRILGRIPVGSKLGTEGRETHEGRKQGRKEG